jgi:hypothetical protein
MLFSVLCILVIACLAGIVRAETVASLSSTARNTYYDSYPKCCPASPNYDPKAPTDECDDYSGCKYMGDFAAFCTNSNPDGHVSIDYVKSHNLISFYDNSDKTVQLTKTYNGKTYKFNATIADTCGNSDCNNCCSRNSDPNTGYLVDMEYYTVINNFGNINAASGSVSFVIF